MTTVVHATGILRHCFFGEYSAIISLAFDDEACAADALKTLGDDWRPGKGSQALVWSGRREALEVVKTQLAGFGLRVIPCGFPHCKDQCVNAEIDGLPHSVDVGPSFEVSIPVEPAEQLSMFKP